MYVCVHNKCIFTYIMKGPRRFKFPFCSEAFILLKSYLCTLQLLSYPTHSDYVTEVRMAKSSLAVRNFLEGLSVRLTPLLDQEMDVLQKLKVGMLL